ncbi:MAG: hypothetical protein K6F19_06825 [Oscillospiraceae bacterium]|nr:hypothetical protein [Oscillospiraceae bacterium]
MGYGSYTAGDWAKLRSSKGLTAGSRVEQVYTAVSASPVYDSRNVPFRESRDSADSPRATPVIIGFDVTASMGYLAKELAVHGMDRTVTALCERRPISDPQIICAAIGDSKCDRWPLQVTQFEADIRIIRQLTDLCLEVGGGGNGGESYNLLWYFAANHTRTDCEEKRRERGFLFTIGDDLCHPQLSPAEIERVFRERVPYALSSEELIRMAEKRYHVFHVLIETGDSYFTEAWRSWQALLPGRTAVLHRKDLACLPELITAVITAASGKPVSEALKALDQDAAERVARSMSSLRFGKKPADKLTF